MPYYYTSNEVYGDIHHIDDQGYITHIVQLRGIDCKNLNSELDNTDPSRHHEILSKYDWFEDVEEEN